MAFVLLMVPSLLGLITSVLIQAYGMLKLGKIGRIKKKNHERFESFCIERPY